MMRNIDEIKRIVMRIRDGIGPSYGESVLNDVLLILDDYKKLKGNEIICPNCDGKGWRPEGSDRRLRVCQRCNGTGLKEAKP